MKPSDATLAYIWATRPEDVRAAEEAYKADVEAGRAMVPTMTFAQQRRAGMPPPSAQINAQAQAPAGPKLNELDEEAFDKLEELVENERDRRLSESWSEDAA